jgi:hypothetical protein
MKLVGGDADTAARTMQILEMRMRDALRDPGSKMGGAFHNIHISADQLQAGLKDLPGFLDLLADKFKEFGATPEGLVIFRDVLSRGMSKLIPALRDGGEVLEALKRRAHETGSVLDNERQNHLLILHKK